MPTYLREFAKELSKDHPGIPQEHDDNLVVAQELVESMFRVIRNRIIKNGECHLEGIGRLFMKPFKATRRKDPKTGIEYNQPARNVIRYEASRNLTKLVNVGRKVKIK